MLLLVLALRSAADPVPDAELDLAAGWRYRADPKRAGISGRWDGISLDDRRWTTVALGATVTGGAGWWRRWVDLPGEWPSVWIAVDTPAPRTDLFINGTPAVRDLARLSLSRGTAVREITGLVHGRRRFLIALMGDRPPARVRVAASPGGWTADEGDRLRIAAQAAPDLPWPSWLRGEGTAWTTYAPLAGGPAGRLGWEGDLEAGDGLAGVSCWAYDRAARRLLAGPALPGHLAQLRLAERVLPLPEARIGGEARAIRLTLRVWPHVMGDPPFTVGVAEATLENLTGHPREVDLLVAVHPFRPAGTPAPIASLRYDRPTQTFLVDGRPVCVLAGAPDAAGTGPFGAGWEVVADLARGGFPTAQETLDPERRLATGVAAYRLRLQPYGGRTQTFRVLPGAPREALTPAQSRAARELDRRFARAEVEGAFRHALTGKERIFLRVPDKPAQDAFLASLGHLLVARAAGDPDADSPEARAALACAGITTATGSHDTAAAFMPPSAIPESALTGTRWDDRARWTHADGLAPRDAFGLARFALADGDADAAMNMLRWWLARPTTPGAHAWAERVDPLTLRHGGGALPDPVAAARLVLAIRAMVLREDGGSLLLAPALPMDWIKPGAVVDIRHAPTAFGILPGFALRATPAGLELRRVTAEQLSFRGRGPKLDPGQVAQPPDGYRWRIPGKKRIRQVRVDGTTRPTVPADRIVVLSPDFRRAFVGW